METKSLDEKVWLTYNGNEEVRCWGWRVTSSWFPLVQTKRQADSSYQISYGGNPKDKAKSRRRWVEDIQRTKASSLSWWMKERGEWDWAC